MATIREKIIEFLEQNEVQTIKQISKGTGVKENLVRNKIFVKDIGMIAKSEVVKVAHKQRKGYFSLAKNHIDKLEALKLYNDLFKENIDYIMENKKMVNTILDNSELIDKIDKVVKDTELS